MRSRLQHFALVVALFFMIMLLVYGQQEPSEPDRPGILSDIEPRQDPREPDKPGILSHVEPRQDPREPDKPGILSHVERRQDPREPDKPGILSHVERRQEPSEPDRPGVASHLYRRQMPDPPLTTSGMSSEFDGVDGPLDPEAVPASMMNITSSDIGTSSCEVSCGNDRCCDYGRACCGGGYWCCKKCTRWTYCEVGKFCCGSGCCPSGTRCGAGWCWHI